MSSETVETELITEKTLPYSYCFSPDKLEKALRILTRDDYEDLSDEMDRHRYDLFLDALADMLNANTASVWETIMRSRGA